MLILGVYFNEDAALSLLARPTLNYEEDCILNIEYTVMIQKFETSQTQTCDELWDEILEEILLRDGNSSQDQVTKEDNRSNK